MKPEITLFRGNYYTLVQQELHRSRELIKKITQNKIFKRNRKQTKDDNKFSCVQAKRFFHSECFSMDFFFLIFQHLYFISLLLFKILLGVKLHFLFCTLCDTKSRVGWVVHSYEMELQEQPQQPNNRDEDE